MLCNFFTKYLLQNFFKIQFLCLSVSFLRNIIPANIFSHTHNFMYRFFKFTIGNGWKSYYIPSFYSNFPFFCCYNCFFWSPIPKSENNNNIQKSSANNFNFNDYINTSEGDMIIDSGNTARSRRLGNRNMNKHEDNKKKEVNMIINKAWMG